MVVCISYAQGEGGLEHTKGTWYMFSSMTDARVEVYEKTIVLSQILKYEDVDPRPADTIHILSRGKSGLLLCEKKDEPEMAVLRLTNEDGVLQITEVLTSEDKNELIEEMESNEGVSGSELFKANYMYSEEVFLNLDKAKGLDEVTADDLEKALLKRNEFGRKMEEMMRKDPELEEDRYRLRRIGEKLMNRTFLQLGYNPFKEVEYNFETMFPNRPDLIELLNGF